MKNLNKKIGVVALSGMMVMGGVVASGLNAYASSVESRISSSSSYDSKDEWLKSKEGSKPKWFDEPGVVKSEFFHGDASDIADVEGGQNIYKYEILDKEEAERWVKNKYFSFADGLAFFDYLKKSGMSLGVYGVQVGKQYYVLKFPKDVKPGIDVFDHIPSLSPSNARNFAQVEEFQKVFEYWLVDANIKDKELSKKLGLGSESYKDKEELYDKLGLNISKSYDDAGLFVVDLFSNRPNDNNLYRFRIKGEDFIFKFKVVDFSKLKKK